MPAVNDSSKCNMRLIQQPGKETTIFKTNAQSFDSTNISYRHISSLKITQLFDYLEIKSLNFKNSKRPVFLKVSFCCELLYSKI